MSAVESARRRMRQGESAAEELTQGQTLGDESITIELAGGELWDSLHRPCLQLGSCELAASSPLGELPARNKRARPRASLAVEAS